MLALIKPPVSDWLIKARGEKIQKARERGAIHTSHDSMNPIVYLLILIKYILFLISYHSLNISTILKLEFLAI